MIIVGLTAIVLAQRPVAIETKPPVEVKTEVVKSEEKPKETPQPVEQPKQKQRTLELKLHRILKGKPLETHISIIIREAEKNGFNPAFTAAIAIKESSGGLKNFRPYNAWGWYGGGGFASWEQSITAWSAYFNRVYISQGKTTPETIQPKYCPNSKTWAGEVRALMAK